jgi:hypothetical protein
MEELQRIPFIFENNQYEVRVMHGDNRIHVLVFSKNYPATNFRYQLLLPKKTPPEIILGTDILEEMVESAKRDIVEKRMEKVKALLNKSYTNKIQ